jgi:TusA-related sulfurtransferase
MDAQEVRMDAIAADSTARAGASADVCQRLVAALARRDFGAVAGCLAADVRFRALVPSGQREALGPAETVAYFERWFGPADHFEPLGGLASSVADKRHLSWRFRVHDQAGWRTVEQQAYATLESDRIVGLDLLCSGFRPDPTPGSQPDARLDAPGESCVTLTPLVRARMAELPSGAVLEVRGDDPAAPESLAAWCRLTGHELVSAAGGAFRLRKK